MIHISPDANQQPGTTVVVVQQQRPQTWYAPRAYWRRRRPYGSLQLGGIALRFPFVVSLGVFGGVLLFTGLAFIATSNLEFWQRLDHADDTEPGLILGSIFIVFGALLVCVAIALGCYAKKKYKQDWYSRSGKPGRTINKNPIETRIAGGYVQAPVGSYPPSPGGQPTGYPPPGGQPTGYPSPTAVANPAPERQVPPPYETEMLDDSTKPSSPEYGTPSAYAPGYPPSC